MRATRIIAVISVIGLTMGAKTTLKQKLAERGNTLVQAEAKTEAKVLAGDEGYRYDCDCECESDSDDECCPVLHNSCIDLHPTDCTCTPTAITDQHSLGAGTF
jgi:hypothetical protein